MSGNVGIFVDLILLALLLIGLVLGWRQGFVQALTRIIVVVAALLLASWIAGKLAEPAARWLEPILSEKLEQRLTAQGNTDDAGEMLAAFGFEGDTLSELVDNAVEKAQQAGETLLSAVVSTALKSAAYAVVYVVSFLLLLLLLRLVLTPLHLFTNIPTFPLIGDHLTYGLAPSHLTADTGLRRCSPPAQPSRHSASAPPVPG